MIRSIGDGDDAEVWTPESAAPEADRGADSSAAGGEAENQAENKNEDGEGEIGGETVGLEAVGLEAVSGSRGRAAAGPSEKSAPSAAAVEPCQAEELKGALESILFSVSEPIGIRALSDLVGAGVHEVRGAVDELRYEYVETQRAFRLEEVAGGVQLLTQSRYDPWIRRLRQKERERRLSAAAFETLAVVAYKQPITKADLEGIRGVGCTPILKTLMDRGLLQVVGREEGLGKPLLYGTTKRFLESFGLESVRDLPRPEDLAAGGASES